MVLLGLVPGLPTMPFFVLAAIFGLVSYRALRTIAPTGAVADAEAAREESDRELAARNARMPMVVPVSVEMGTALAERLIDGRGGVRGTFLEREIPILRDDLFRELGIALPAVRAIRSAALPANGYAIRLHEVPVATGDAIAEDDRAAIARRLEREVRRRARDFVGFEEVQSMLDQLERASPALVRNVVPKPVPLAQLADVLRRLVDEGVSIRPLREILEALAIHAPGEKDPVALTESVRSALRRHITHAHARDGAIAVYVVDPEIEETLRESIHRTATGSSLALAPQTARDVLESVRRATAGAEGRVILLAQSDVRRFLRRLIEVELPDVVVLSYQELDPGITVQQSGRIAA
jgi:type III secretion protein V